MFQSKFLCLLLSFASNYFSIRSRIRSHNLKIERQANLPHRDFDNYNNLSLRDSLTPTHPRLVALDIHQTETETGWHISRQKNSFSTTENKHCENLAAAAATPWRRKCCDTVTPEMLQHDFKALQKNLCSSVWPDLGIKRSPIFPNVVQKVAAADLN